MNSNNKMKTPCERCFVFTSAFRLTTFFTFYQTWKCQICSRFVFIFSRSQLSNAPLAPSSRPSLSSSSIKNVLVGKRKQTDIFVYRIAACINQTDWLRYATMSTNNFCIFKNANIYSRNWHVEQNLWFLSLSLNARHFRTLFERNVQWWSLSHQYLPAINETTWIKSFENLTNAILLCNITNSVLIISIFDRHFW